MRVMVTGGTGFLGAHTVKALLDAGHEVHMLVRSEGRIGPALEPLGISDFPSHTVGDVTDRTSVEQSLQGCDAVVHSASIYSFHAKQAAAIKSTNVTGTDNVLGIAHQMGLDPIVHVSSYVALLPPDGQILSPDSPVKTPSGVYFKSKADSDRIARAYQADGAPVVIVYPGVILGPHDPHWGEGPQVVKNVLMNPMNMFPPGGLQFVDVRDVAKIHAAVMEPKRGPRRFMATGIFSTPREIASNLSSVTGRNVRLLTLPAWSLWGTVMLADTVQKIFKIKLPITKEQFDAVRWNARCDDSKTISELGIQYRDSQETLSEMVRWMHQTGGLSSKLAGKAAS